MSRRTWNTVQALAFGAVALAFAPRANAASIAMMETLLPAPGEADPTGGTVIATMIQPFVTEAYSGTLESTVIEGDTSNPNGGLTFTFIVTNDETSVHPINRVTFNGWMNFLADVSFQSPTGDKAPTLINHPHADVLGYSYLSLGPGFLLPGETSAMMVIQSDATDFIESSAGVINGFVAEVPTFAPIPEPGTISLLAAGALLVLRRRRA